MDIPQLYTGQNRPPQQQNNLQQSGQNILKGIGDWFGKLFTPQAQQPARPPSNYSSISPGIGQNLGVGGFSVPTVNAVSEKPATQSNQSAQVKNPSQNISMSPSPARPSQNSNPFNIPTANASGFPQAPVFNTPNPSQTQIGNDTYGQPIYQSAGNTPGQNTVSPPSQVSPVSQTDTSQPDRFAQYQALIDKVQGAGEMTPAELELQTKLNQLYGSEALGLNKISNIPQPMDLITGQSAYLRGQAEAQAVPLTSQLATLQARRQASLAGATAALQGGQAALQYQNPVALGIGQALVSPKTGESIAGNAAYTGSPQEGGGSISGLVQSLAQQVISGQLSPSQAVSQLPSSALSGMLNQEITKQQPGFNFANAEQNFQTRGAALSQNATVVRPMVNSQQTAIQHLNNLEGVLNKVAYGNTPLLNSLKEGWSNYVQSDPNIRQLQSEINIIRSEVAKVLGGGSTTVESLNEAQGVLPDKISPEQFAQVKKNIEDLMQSKIEQYTNLGNIQQFPTNGTGGENQEGQTIQSGGYTFKLVNGKWTTQ